MTPAQLVGYVRAALGAPYWYACYGQTASLALLTYKKQQYPGMYTPARVARCATQFGRRVWDCVGLIKGAYWDMFYGGRYHAAEDLSADGMFARCTQVGPMSDMPETPGIVLHFPGHIAVYEGKGQCIEERGFASGCVRSPVKGRGFTAWGKCHLVDYPTEDNVMYKPGDKGDDVKSWQASIVRYGIPLPKSTLPDGTLDGSYGPEVTEATSRFQGEMLLPVNGIGDDVTVARMMAMLRGYEDAQAAKAKALEVQLSASQAALAGATLQRDKAVAAARAYVAAEAALGRL